MSANPTMPERSAVPAQDQWDLSGLFESQDAWEAAFDEGERAIPRLADFRGRLAESAETLRDYLVTELEVDRLIDRVNQFARRSADVDKTNGTTSALEERARGLVSRFGQARSFFSSEVVAIPDETIQAWLELDILAPWKRTLECVLRDKPHTLGESEEQLLALANETIWGPFQIFEQLNASDMTFGIVTDGDGNEHAVTHGAYRSVMGKPDRHLRQVFWERYYSVYDAHRHTLAATLAAGVKAHVFGARARKFESVRHAALHPNAIPVSVYDNLVETVGRNLAPLERFHAIVAKQNKATPLRPWDVYAPVLGDVQLGRPYEDAVDLVVDSLAPLGERYTSTLRGGLLDGWVDRYENKGKVSGAYSSGCYDSDPFILMNYRDDSIEPIYTLAHEAGHSMHTWHAKAQTPQDSGYSIFVAEVASTFNECLLTNRLLEEHADNPRARAAILAREIAGLRGLIYRQTMFAEYEKLVYDAVESHKALGLAELRGIYRGLLEHHLAGVELHPLADLECLRVPHFYFKFYVYQYATGVSAALALANRVLSGVDGALEAYLGFLSAGGSADPIDVLKAAGVDMTSPEPVEAALAHFERRVGELESLLEQLA